MWKFWQRKKKEEETKKPVRITSVRPAVPSTPAKQATPTPSSPVDDSPAGSIYWASNVSCMPSESPPATNSDSTPSDYSTGAGNYDGGTSSGGGGDYGSCDSGGGSFSSD
jgi:hypothetical protein